MTSDHSSPAPVIKPWLAVVVAALAMVATLPGRTHGLGLITEPLMAHLKLGKIEFAALNFWATIIGAAFCIPVGWLIDRCGIRWVQATVLLALGVIVLMMAGLPTPSRFLPLYSLTSLSLQSVQTVLVPTGLFLLVLLTRGFGQSALSVVSLALVGKSSGSRPGKMIGWYSFLVAIGFMLAFGVIKLIFDRFHATWNTVWAGIGWCLIGFAFFSTLVIRTSSQSSRQSATEPSTGHTLFAAMKTPAFWVYALATSFYGMVAAGMSLFNQSLLAERGFDRSVFLTITALAPGVGLLANLLCGYFASRVHLGILLAVGLLIQAGALFSYPHVTTLTHVYAYAVAMGIAGGIQTVIFFTVWRQAFGLAHLGKIQGLAQLITVFASAAGPLVFATGHAWYGQYAPIVQQLAIIAVGFAAIALLVPLPGSKTPIFSFFQAKHQ
ncbi:MAG: MFS transporter [Zavarzinella sp.]